MIENGTYKLAPVAAIRLRRDGEYIVVDVEMGGDFIEVIREHSEGPFSHIVSASGVFSAYYAAS